MQFVDQFLQLAETGLMTCKFNKLHEAVFLEASGHSVGQDFPNRLSQSLAVHYNVHTSATGAR
jgi:hypothetical protein